MKRKALRDIISIHKEAVAISKAYRKNEIDLIRIIQRVDEFKVYRSYKYKSLYQYCMLSLRLSEHQSYTFINVARKARSIKMLSDAIQRGSVSVSKARRFVPVINHENASEWVKNAETLSQKHLERAVAKVSPRSTVNEGAHYISESMLELRVAISEETERMLKRVQDLSSQKNRKHRGLEDVLREMARDYLEKYDPVLRAKRVIERKLKAEFKKANEKSDGDAREQNAREQNAREQNAREQNAREQNAREQNAREQNAREQNGNSTAASDITVQFMTETGGHEDENCLSQDQYCSVKPLSQSFCRIYF